MPSTFLDLSAQECRSRLEHAVVGRVAFCGSRGPQIYPVNYVLDGADVVFRTAPYTRLGLEVSGRPVAFEIDALDEDARSGWSVVVTGLAAAVDDPDDILRLHRTGPQAWAPGRRPLLVRVSTRSVTGRQVTADG